MRLTWIVLLLLGLSQFACRADAPGTSEPRPFDAVGWRQGSTLDRHAMHQSLLSERLLHGRPRAEVLALLGPADWENVAEGVPTLYYTLDTGVVFEDDAIGNPRIHIPLIVRIDPATQRVDSVLVGGWEY